MGLKKIQYENYEPGSYADETKEELEAALATPPNGALFGSSYYRSFFAPSLWIWNAFSEGESGFSKWMTSSFGKAPVLMSWVNPELRATVAQSVLRKHGYFHGFVGYDVETQKNPKKAKIAYRVNMGPLFTIDTLQYIGFPAEADTLIRLSAEDALIHRVGRTARWDQMGKTFFVVGPEEHIPEYAEGNIENYLLPSPFGEGRSGTCADASADG